MPKPEKVERVAELKARIEGSDALLLTEYRGLSGVRDHRAPPVPRRGRRELRGGQEHPDATGRRRRRRSPSSRSCCRDPPPSRSSTATRSRRPSRSSRPPSSSPPWCSRAGSWTGSSCPPTTRRRSPTLESREVMLSQDRRDAEERDEPKAAAMFQARPVEVPLAARGLQGEGARRRTAAEVEDAADTQAEAAPEPEAAEAAAEPEAGDDTTEDDARGEWPRMTKRRSSERWRR